MLEKNKSSLFILFHTFNVYVLRMLSAKLALMHNLCSIMNNATLLNVNQTEKKPQCCILASGNVFAFYSSVVMSTDFQVIILFHSSLTFHIADRIKFKQALKGMWLNSLSLFFHAIQRCERTCSCVIFSGARQHRKARKNNHPVLRFEGFGCKIRTWNFSIKLMLQEQFSTAQVTCHIKYLS